MKSLNELLKEGDVWREGVLMLFFLYLLRDRWFHTALLVSLALLLHAQGEAFIPPLAFYRPPPVPVGLRDDGGAHSKDKGGGIPGGSSRA